MPRLPIHDPNVSGRKRWVFLGSFLSAGAAGGVATLVFYPLEYARTRLAMDGKKREFPNGSRDVIRKGLATDGLRGLYRGFAVALGGNVVFRALHMGGYDFAKNEVSPSWVESSV